MIAIKAALVLATGLAALASMRRQPAAARHRLLAAAIVSAGLLPALELVAPAWSFTLATPPAFTGATAAEGDLVRLIWLAGAAVGFASLAAGFLRLAWLAAGATRDVPPAWLSLVRDLSSDLGVPRPVEILESRTAAMPMTWGLWRPRILLPSAAREWTTARLRAVVGHELAHAQRGDWAVQIAAELAVCVYWYNPLAWIARRRLRFESDRACDDAVLAMGVSGPDYANALVSVARELRDRRDGWRVAAALARPGHLERRVAAALSAQIDRSPLSAVSSAVVLVACVAIALPIAGFSTQPVPPRTAALSDVQRNIMMRLGAQEWNISVVASDASFWKNRIEGRVELQARLGVDGSLSAVRVVEPVHPDMATAAAAIARQWRRDPALVRGVPVEVPVRMTVDFRR